MAVYHGSAGSLSIGGTSIASVQEWSVSHTAEMVETTSLGNTARTFSKGLESFEGSCEAIVVSDDATGFYDFNANLKTGTELAVIFYVDDTSGADVKLNGNVLISSVETATTMDDIARYSITFTGTDESPTNGTYWCYFDQIDKVEASAVNNNDWMND